MHLDLDSIARAARDIDPVFRSTPQFEAEALGRRIGARVLLKVETANPIRSFKGRGTDYFLRTLNPLPRRMVTASAGNFGQGLAYAARARGVILDVFAAESANKLKVTRMRELGATVRLAGHDFDDAKSQARVYAKREGLMFVEDGHETAIAEGAGSMAVELCQWREPIATMLVPLGNGALLGGIGAWMKAHSPATRIIGVCAAGAPAMRDSLRSNSIVQTERVETIADGIAVRVPVPAALEYLRPVVDDVVLVTDHAIRRAMDLVRDETGLTAEPAGVAGLAALFATRSWISGDGLVATPLCGSNVAQ